MTEDQHLSPEEWARWNKNPVTLKYLQYMYDFRIQIASSIAEAVSYGHQITPEVIHRDTTQCEVLLMLSNLSIEDINSFYQPEEKEEDDETSGQ